MKKKNVSDNSGRRGEIKKALVEIIEKVQPEEMHSFEMSKIIANNGTKGLLRDKVGITIEERKIVKELIQELIREDEILIHKSGDTYIRVK
jgi:hypothetical protein